jgi:hypothetical protein
MNHDEHDLRASVSGADEADRIDAWEEELRSFLKDVVPGLRDSAETLGAFPEVRAAIDAVARLARIDPESEIGDLTAVPPATTDDDGSPQPLQPLVRSLFTSLFEALWEVSVHGAHVIEACVRAELAADALGIGALESRVASVLPQQASRALEACGGLMSVVAGLVRRAAGAAPLEEWPSARALVWARVVPPAKAPTIERSDALTPYAAQDIVADALYAGPGARLEVRVPPDTCAADMAELEGQFAWIARRGVHVDLRRSASLRGDVKQLRPRREAR